jgi:hypothetical protein
MNKLMARYRKDMICDKDFSRLRYERQDEGFHMRGSNYNPLPWNADILVGQPSDVPVNAGGPMPLTTWIYGWGWAN